MEQIAEYLQNASIYSPGIIIILITVGFIVGFINTIAGMATAISYGLFMALGLPINIANGTTRLGVLLQFLTSSVIFKKKGYDVNVVNTICNATEERQTEAKVIASKVDAMIVIGGTHSSNTRKLYEICKKECENTFFIQTLQDLQTEFLKGIQRVGITAGASTPKNIIEEVQNYVKLNF